MGFGLYSYYVRELFASLFLFSALFLAIGLIVLGAVVAWYASKQVALWSKLVLRSAIALASSGGPPRSAARQVLMARYGEFICQAHRDAL